MELINRELSMKEKAEAYDRALEIAKSWHKLDNNDLSNTDLEILFPSLKESEDEGIRKALMEFLSGKRIISNDLEGINIDKTLIWLEKQDDQKSTGKTESKFNVGDWVVNKLGNIWHIDSFDAKNYQVTTTKGEHNYFPVNLQDRMHLWTIQDAKDGDILAEDTCIFIIKKLNNDLSAKIYCCLYDDGDFDNLTSNLAFDDKCTYPATAEQRDILFKGMEEAGYEWDSEKKELKKIEQKEEDIHDKLTAFEFSLKHIMEEAIECGDTHNLKADADMLLRLIQNPIWSEEDERNLNDAILFIETGTYSLDKDNLINWLKSLRPQWKPSDEQIVVLELASKYERVFTSKQIDILIDLKNQLKKLKGE